MGALRNFLFGGPGTATSLGDVGLLIMRIGLGLYIAAHGWGKVWAGGTPGPSSQFVTTVGNLGFPQPTLFAWGAGITEFGGGLLLALGLLTRPVALALCCNMAVAAFLRHGGDAWYVPPGTRAPSKELAMLYLLPFLLILLIGGGRFAIDSLLRKHRKPLPKRTDQ